MGRDGSQEEGDEWHSRAKNEITKAKSWKEITLKIEKYVRRN